ncbi:MAG: RecX family transcriptional regulator [Chloroflexota bacterium]
MKKITALRAEGEREKRVSVYLNGKRSLRLAPEVALKEKLAVGQELTEEKIAAMEKLNVYQHTMNAATRFLSHRPCSESELREKLRRRSFSDSNIEQVITRLKELGLIDDVAFAEFWRENRDSFSPRSRYLTGLELQRKGVSREITDAITSTLNDEDSAYRAARSRSRRLPSSDYQIFRQRLGAYLRRRGFTYDVINPTVERLWQELDDRTAGNSSGAQHRMTGQAPSQDSENQPPDSPQPSQRYEKL